MTFVQTGSAGGNYVAGYGGMGLPPPVPPKTAPGTRQVTLYDKGTSAIWGQSIPVSAGIRRLPSYPIWLRDYMTYTLGSSAYYVTGVEGNTFAVEAIGPGNPQSGTLATWAVSFGYPLDPTGAEGRVVRAIWADGRLIWSAPAGATSGSDPVQGFTWTFYPGSEDQLQDPDMVSDEGAATTPAYRGMMYMVIKNFPLYQFACHIPSITAEIADIQYNQTSIDDEGDVSDSPMEVAAQLQLLCNGQPWNYNGITDDKLSFDQDSFFPADPDDMDMANTGIIIDQDWALADVLNAYAAFYDFSFLESGFGLKFLKPVTAGAFDVAAILEEGDLIDSGNTANGCLLTTRADPGQIPTIMTVSYYDVSQQFQLSIQRARRQQFPQQNVFAATAADIAVPVICTASQALTGCTRALYRGAHGQLSHQFTLAPNFLYLEPGDVVQINRRTGKTYFAQIVYAEIQPDLSTNVTAVNIAYSKPGNLIGYGGQQVLVTITSGLNVGNVLNASVVEPLAMT